MSEGSLRERLGRVLLGVWIFGVGLFFFVRFSFEFYRANRQAIEGLLERLLK